MDILVDKKRKARKNHQCDYCDGIIEKGEIYDYAKLKSYYADGIYEWKSHEKCSFIAGALWNYIDPDEGMTREDFQEGCFEFCRAFICKDCEHYDKENEECEKDNKFCIDKMFEFLQTHDFKRIKDKHGWSCTWKCFPKEDLNE